jgi:hypothetical protein
VSDFNLNKGTGDRVYTIEVKFPKEFKVKPDINLNVTMVEGDKNADLKYDLQTSFITTEGFIIKIKTWGEGKIRAIGGTWFAISK